MYEVIAVTRPPLCYPQQGGNQVSNACGGSAYRPHKPYWMDGWNDLVQGEMNMQFCLWPPTIGLICHKKIRYDYQARNVLFSVQFHINNLPFYLN